MATRMGVGIDTPRDVAAPAPGERATVGRLLYMTIDMDHPEVPPGEGPELARVEVKALPNGERPYYVPYFVTTYAEASAEAREGDGPLPFGGEDWGEVRDECRAMMHHFIEGQFARHGGHFFGYENAGEGATLAMSGEVILAEVRVPRRKKGKEGRK